MNNKLRRLPKVGLFLLAGIAIVAGTAFTGARVLAGNGLDKMPWLKEYNIPGLSAEKQALLEKEKNERVEAVLNLPQAAKDQKAPEYSGPPKVATGVYPFSGFGPFSPEAVKVSNIAVSLVGDTQFTTYAGLRKSDGKGVLVIHSLDFRNGTDSIKSFDSGIAGSLTVESVEGQMVTVLASDGTKVTFDLLSSTFGRK